MESKLHTIENRIYLERVRLFFGNAIGNIASAIVGAIFIALVLKSANAVHLEILVWFSFIIFFSIITVYIEKLFRNELLTINNVSKWYYTRIIPSSLISLMYGLTPFLFSSYLGVQEELFIFIILSAMVSVAIVGYTTMPYYYILLNGLTMIPLTIYFLSFSDSIHNILAVTAIIWQYLVISKGWKVSRLAIDAITITEQLHDEIEHHKKTKEKLHQLATHDALTGLPNRRLLMDNLDAMTSLARRHHKEVITMFIDLDGFKNVNDMHGHEAGDYVLRKVSQRLKLQTRESDILARLGGDEFILSCIDIDDKRQNVDMWVKRILNSLSKPIILPNGHTVQIGTSIGIAKFPHDGDSPADLLRISDANMYIAKSKGGGKFIYTDTSI